MHLCTSCNWRTINGRYDDDDDDDDDDDNIINMPVKQIPAVV